MSLGLGYTFFGEEFLSSDHTQVLRQALWEKDPKKALATKLFIGNLRQDIFPDPYLAWDGLHTISLIPYQSSLLLSVSCFGSKPIFVKMVEGAGKWLKDRVPEAIVYVSAPQISRFLGVFSLEKFIEHRLGGEQIDELKGFS